LNALRAFEATARHLSVKKAAEELHVTPGAVSQLLKGLEARVGTALLRRAHRAVFLTDAGQNYLPPVRSALTQLAEATRRIASATDGGTLSVSTTPSFAATWLVPRLPTFQQAHPAIDLRLLTGKGLVDFTRDDVDVAIRHGLGRYPGLRSERLFAVELVPVAAPELTERQGRPRSADALANWPLLHDAERQDWPLWLQAQGVPAAPPPRGPAFDDPGLLRQAAIAGQGAALLAAALVEADIAQDRLSRLWDAAWPEAFAYYLVYPPSSAARPKVAAFRDWALAAAAPGDTPDASALARDASGRTGLIAIFNVADSA
jgi:LysR family glycine cleavage system transcriptional activator